jgi:hypothetical protein
MSVIIFIRSGITECSRCSVCGFWNVKCTAELVLNGELWVVDLFYKILVDSLCSKMPYFFIVFRRRL